MIFTLIALLTVRPEDTAAKTLSPPPPSAQMQVQANLVKLEHRINQVAAQRGYAFEKAKLKCPYCKPGKEGVCCKNIVARKGDVVLVRKAGKLKK